MKQPLNAHEVGTSLKVRVGLFTLLGLFIIGLITVTVNDKPSWWKPCQIVHINVEDATGLKTKSPVRSLGIQIGYLKTIELGETEVRLGICVTANVEMLPSTRGYIRGEGFLGDKFVELRPLKYLGVEKDISQLQRRERSFYRLVFEFLIPSASAETNQSPAVPGVVEMPAADANPSSGTTSAVKPVNPKTRTGDVPMGKNDKDIQAVVEQVNGLVGEMHGVVKNLKQVINPDDLKNTIKQLNATLENASRTLSPQGALTSTAQRTLAKLEDAIEQLRDQLTRINQGKGSVGALLNDPEYAQEIKLALKKMNRLLGKADTFRLQLDINLDQLGAYNGARAAFSLLLWPSKKRYYRVGLASDPRGLITAFTTTTTVGGQSTTVQTTQVQQGSMLLTGMLGWVVLDDMLDISLGFLYGDGVVRTAVRFGPEGKEDRIQLVADVYSRAQGVTQGNSIGLDSRVFAQYQPIPFIYLKGGMEGFKTVNGKVGWLLGAGITFDDDDIKLLLALR